MQDCNCKIKLLVCYHKPSQLLKDEILTPIHVGRANAKKKMDHKSENYKWLMDNLIGDDTGDNISSKNGSYNEMTSLYWAWKNYEKLGNPDYIGLMHYRRHFVLHEGEIDVIPFEGMDEHYSDEINYSIKNMKNLVKDCDFITHIGKVNNVYKHYVENHRQEDLDLAFDIVYEKYPEYKPIAEEYFAGDYSNFCNMFIFNKSIFFNYCEWIFSILEEFERRVDVSEKRFFISERLTGVFIAKLMKDETLKYKVLPIAFVEEPARIPIMMPLRLDNEFALATTITSVLLNKEKKSHYDICLIHGSDVEEKVRDKFKAFEDRFDNCSVKFKITDIKQEYYPLCLSEMFPEYNKCIYMEENSVVLKDLAEFYRTCSVDDFYVVGAPLNKYDAYDIHKKLNTSFLVMNCASFRKHKICERAFEDKFRELEALEVFNELLEGQIGYIPWYFITLAESAPYLLSREKTRGSYQADAVWKPIIFYNNLVPWLNPQCMYSNFWWDIAKKVSAEFKFPKCSLYVLEEQFRNNQIEINHCAHIPDFVSSDPENHNVNQKEEQETIEIPAIQKQEDWRDYSFWGKLKFYYEHNGMKQTIHYGIKKISGGEN